MNEFEQKKEEYKKIIELLEIVDLNIDYNEGHFMLDNIYFKEFGNTFINHENNQVIIIRKKADELSLLVVENEKLEYISLALNGSNNIKIIRCDNHNITKVVLTNRSVNLSMSNVLTDELDSILKEYKIKFNIPKIKNLEYQELIVELPILIDKNIYELSNNISLCKSILIYENRGIELETKIDDNKGTSIMRTFNISHSLLKNSILSKYKIDNKFELLNMTIDPTSSAGVSYALKPLRYHMIKELYELLINAETGGLKRYYLRYFDDVIIGINYFQNEAKNNFSVFEENKKLQVK